MTKDEALSRLIEAREIGRGDPEAAHSMADETLCELLKALGHEDIVEAFNNIDMWYA